MTGGLSQHQIGGVLGSLPGMIITHFINWTFQAVGDEGAPAVAELVRQAIQRGSDAVEWELSRREGRTDPIENDYACYRCLSEYSEKQLSLGLNNYQRALQSGAWEITLTGGQLWFSSTKGRWLEREGVAFWQAR